MPFTNSERPMKNQIEIPCSCIAPPCAYQKIMFRITKTVATTTAQNTERW